MWSIRPEGVVPNAPQLRNTVAALKPANLQLPIRADGKDRCSFVSCLQYKKNHTDSSTVACKRLSPGAYDAVASSAGESAQTQAAAPAAVQAWMESESTAAWYLKIAETTQFERTDLPTCQCAEPPAQPHPAAAPPPAAAAVAAGDAGTAAVVSVLPAVAFQVGMRLVTAWQPQRSLGRHLAASMRVQSQCVCLCGHGGGWGWGWSRGFGGWAP